MKNEKMKQVWDYIASQDQGAVIQSAVLTWAFGYSWAAPIIRKASKEGLIKPQGTKGFWIRTEKKGV